MRITRAFAMIVAGALSACGRPADTAAGNDGGGAATERVFTAEQVQHGGVRWAAAQPVAMAATVEVAGQLLPNEDRTARLSAPAQGRILAVHVQPGDPVTPGTPLATLQSQAAAAARADYIKAAAELSSRNAAAAYARSTKERAERLLAIKAVARQEVERARADDELAQSGLLQARAELDRTRAALAQLGVDSASGAMILRSPLAGVVLSREALPGNVVEAGAPLVMVTDPTSLWLQVAATDRLASALRTGSAVRFVVPAFPSDTFQAHVQSVGGGLDSVTRTVPVRALVENVAGRLRPQMFATVWIEGGATREGIIVPDSALQLLDQRPVLFVASAAAGGGTRFERRDVEIGARARGRTQVVAGVKPGELVVIAGAFAVKSEFARSKMVKE